MIDHLLSRPNQPFPQDAGRERRRLGGLESVPDAEHQGVTANNRVTRWMGVCLTSGCAVL